MVKTNVTDGEVAVFDLFGRQMMSTPLHNGRAELDFSSVTKGVYMARISGDDGVKTVRLIKE